MEHGNEKDNYSDNDLLLHSVSMASEVLGVGLLSHTATIGQYGGYPSVMMDLKQQGFGTEHHSLANLQVGS